MVTNSPFKKLYSNFLHAVQNNGNFNEILSHIRCDKTTESMFQYFWELEEAHRCLDFNILESSKSKKQSDNYRIEGNIYFQRGQLDQALELYNMCILLAPTHPANTNMKEMQSQDQYKDNDQKRYTSLAYGFANRSAVLFELEQYEQCINDIDFALRFGYPKEQICKLIERKANCLLEMEHINDAIYLINSTITFVSTLNMTENKKITQITKLKSLLKTIHKGQSFSEQSFDGNIPSGDILIENLMNIKINDDDSFDSKINHAPENIFPSLSSPHSTILSVSSALRLQYTPEQGRFFVAEKDIKPGELILVEKSPFRCLYLEKDILHSHCCVCLKKCKNPLPCNRCTMVMFCSETCQSQSLNGHTDVECQSLQTLESLCIGNCCTLALKIIIQIPFMKLKGLIPDYKIQIAENSPNMQGFNRNGKFDSSDFLSTYSLVGNLSQRDYSDLLNKVAMAFILANLLIKSKSYFIDDTGLPFHPSDEDIVLLGSTLFTLIMNISCNAHSIEELQSMNNDMQAVRSIGVAMFPAESLLNHSCNPGIVRYALGGQMTSYAIRFIPKGSEVADSYGPHYMVHDTNYRQAILKKKYQFECKCEACNENWTISDSPLSDPKFNILNAKNMDEERKKEEECKRKYTILRNNYVQSYFNIITGNIRERDRQVVIDFIEFLDRYIVFPCKLYHDAQELLKTCIDRDILSRSTR